MAWSRAWGLASWPTGMSGAPLPSSSPKTSVRVVSGRRHAGSTPSKAVALATAARYLWPQGERLQKKDFLFAEVDSEDLC